MIEVQNLTRVFGDKKAVDNISFNVEKGEILGFLGPNAAGKTTTMRILTCYLPATSGTAKVAGYDVFDDSIEVKKRIGYLPENPPLYKEMVVENYLHFVAKIKGIEPRERKKKVRNVLERCAIMNVKDRIIGKLSKGYRQRVGLAQALIHNPDVLILDEPTSSLDPKQIIEVRELIKNLSGEHTIILSTHILPEVSMTCERVIIINEGKLVAVDTPENLTKKLRSSDKLMLDIEGPFDEVKSKLKEIPGVTRVSLDKFFKEGRGKYHIETKPDVDLRKTLAQTVINNNWGLYELRSEGMSLEEIFLKLTTKE
ncbi:ABC transporter ATP-binding protein [candidate division KSB1 bacterium]|nr:MAG: ABC transporter ATP-binding protein [candidate division KSB1 bacterium]